MSKTIGILGGMGPLATLDLFQKIVDNTPAKQDQDHLRILIYNNPKIPPRKKALPPHHSSPLPELIISARKLEQAGSDFIIMPCHTAHIWYSYLQEAIAIPFYSMIENTVQNMILQKNDYGKKVLLLATEATIDHRLYQGAFMGSPFDIIEPSIDEQKVVDRTIASVKAGNLKSNPHLEDLILMIRKYKEDAVSTVLGGCTEIPLLFPYLDMELNTIDPTLMLARMAIQRAS